MKVYAIKNIQTGLFLENGKPLAKTNAKFSNKNTRLFTEKRAATNAMNCWLLGPWTQKYYDGVPEGPIPPKKIPDDRKEVAPYLKVVMAECIFNDPT